MAILTPGRVGAVDLNPLPPGWVAGSVRFEPVQPGGALTVAGLGTFRGAIEVRRTSEALAVVNDVALEDYVRGIDEMPPGWPAAALQAQAIAARTYALARAAAGADTPWRAVGADICATSACQVYDGMVLERSPSGSAWLAAVDATAGRLLLAGGRPILASYSADADAPSTMSQNGALAMAQEGRTAADILAAYYGIRPTAAGRGQLPLTIRVALALSTPSVHVRATGPVRVVDADGGPVPRPAGQASWTVEPGPAGVRLAPPAPSPVRVALDVPVQATPVASTTMPRRPGRVLVAGGSLPHRGPWPLVAAGLALAAGGWALTAAGGDRRRNVGAGAGG